MKYTSSYDIVKDIIEKLGGDSTIKFSSVYQQAKYIAEMYGADPNRDWSSTFQILLYIYHNFTPPTPETKVTVTFDILDAEGTAPAAIKVEPGTTIILPGAETFEKPGYDFNGWLIDGVRYDGGAEYAVEGDKVAEADYLVQWNWEGLTFVALEDGSALAQNHYGTNTGDTHPILQYTLDCVNWYDWDGSEIDVNKNQRIGIKGSRLNAQNASALLNPSGNRSQFTMAGSFDIEGNMLSVSDETMQATTLNTSYCQAFRGCNGLIAAKNAYLDVESTIYGTAIFAECTTLVSAPRFNKANTLGWFEWNGMFSGCRSLQSINIPRLKGVGSTQGSTNWVANVPSGGEITLNTVLMLGFGVSAIPSGWTIKAKGATTINDTAEIKASTFQELNKNVTIQFDSEAGNSYTITKPDWVETEVINDYGDRHVVQITLTENGGAARSGNVSFVATDKTITIKVSQEAYVEPNFDGAFQMEAIEDGTVSLNLGGTHQTTTKPLIYYSLNGGDKVYWDGSEVSLNSGDIIRFVSNPLGGSTNYARFVNSGAVKLSGDLMSIDDIYRTKTQATASAFYGVFKDNTGIVNASELIMPSSLNTYCFSRMFENCTNLLYAPAELPATNGTTGVYEYMFNGCTNLISVPDIKMTTMTYNTYMYVMRYMFQNCKNIVEAPKLLTKDLKSTTSLSKSYEAMFNGCSKLNHIYCLATTNLGGNNFSSFSKGVAASGSFVQAIEATLPSGAIPSGWTVIYYDATDDTYWLEKERVTQCDEYGNPV